jgi:hypothetical protein
MNALRAEHYRKRAIDFYRCMELVQADDEFRSSSALLAIHSAISLSDALRAGLGDEELYAEDHRQAIASLRRLLDQRRVATAFGYPQFEYLISMKSFVSYGDQRLDEKRAMRIALAAERFSTWVSEVVRSLKMEGWSDERD